MVEVEKGQIFMSNVFETLQERGFIKQFTDEEALRRALNEGQATFYVGFDPTADSLHLGHLLPIMAMAHLQSAGHKPIAIIGGGTAMVGDPSGKTEMRQLLSREDIEANGVGILAQLQRYLNLDGQNGLFLNNADWLMTLNYIEFLRDIGRHFRVNEMIKAESYRARLEREEGLSFIEFNYQLLQAYDFYHLAKTHGCNLQMGGDDQWSNILAGVDLTRRMLSKTTYGLTFPLLTTASGAKMGKTAKGAVWLDANRTSPYEFYQYWVNCDDRDTQALLGYFTFLPMEEVRRLGALEGADLRLAKETLAYEATRLCHGEAAAEEARAAAKAAFGGEGDLSAVPSTEMAQSRLEDGVLFTEILVEAGLAASKGAARRLVEQGGAYLNNEAISDPYFSVNASHLQDGALMLRSGKKKYHRVVVV
jgi:tyrosyl-tRNA synthetase